MCYYITFKIAGKKTTEKIGWLSEGYSPQVASELRADRVRTGRHGKTVKTARQIRIGKIKHDQTLAELKKAYFEAPRDHELKGRYTDNNRFDKHVSFLGDKRVSELTELDITRIKRNMKDLKPATVGAALEILRRIINYGAKHKLCPPLAFIIKLPKKNNIVTEYLTDAEANRLHNVLASWPRQDIARMIRVAWFTGLRRGEIFKLKIENLDFVKEIITLKDPKGGRDETIPMTAPVKAILQAQIQFLKDEEQRKIVRYRNTTKPAPPWEENGFVFPGPHGKKRTDCSAVSRIKEKAGLPNSFRPFHGLRHHMAVTLISSGEYTLDMVGELLTHKDSAVTRRYAQFLPKAKKEAAERAAEILAGQTQKSKKVVSMDEETC